MRIDLYTKTILTVIALLLAVIALKPILIPQPVMAQGKLGGIVFTGAAGGFWAIDIRSGDAWFYDTAQDQKFNQHFKIAEPGKPLTN